MVRMLFKQLTSPNEALVELAHQGLAVIITHTRMPKVLPVCECVCVCACALECVCVFVTHTRMPKVLCVALCVCVCDSCLYASGVVSS